MKIELSREQLEYVLHLLHNREKTLNKRTSEKADFELLKIDGDRKSTRLNSSY